MPVVKKLNNSIQENTYGRLNILVADDHTMTADLEADTLRKSGFLVHKVSTIDEMKHTLGREKIDIVLMDYSFKKGQGIQEIKKAKSKSKNSKVKFLVTSVQSYDDIKENSYENQCDLFLIKPIQRSILIQEIKKLAKQDYRRTERLKCDIPFIVINGQNVYETVAIDISSEGTHLLDKESKINPYVGLELSLEFILPKTSEIIKVKGLIVRITEQGFGIKFHNISENDKNKIKNYILTSSVNVRSVHYYL
jgi:DNA-binding response OmpR family regulator